MRCEDTINEITALSTFTLLARPLKSDGTIPALADIDSITLVIRDISDPMAITEVATVLIVADDYYSTTLQTDRDWPKKVDSQGYSFYYDSTAPDQDLIYRYAVTFEFIDGTNAIVTKKVRGI